MMPDDGKPQWLTLSDWDEIAPAPQDWTVPGRIPKRQVALLSGPGSAGKSMIALHLCSAHVLARDWLNALPEPGPAFFLDAEDDANQIGLRLTAICKHYDVDFTALSAGGLYVLPLAGQPSLMATVSKSGVVTPTDLFNWLLDQGRKIKPRQIVIASLADVFPGNENDRGQVTQFIGLMKRLAIEADGSVLLVSHPSVVGEQNESGISGSTSWHNAVRSRLYLHGLKANGSEPPDPNIRKLDFKKNQYGGLETAVTLRWRDGMFLLEGAPSLFEKAALEAKADHVFEELVKRFAREGRNVSHTQQARNYAPTAFASESEATLAKLNKRHLEAAMKRLFERGAIKNSPYGPPSRLTDRIIYVE
jgi:RecA-family ATPase